METDKKIITSQSVASVSSQMKDLTVSNLIESWNGEGPVSATEFFNKIDRAAKSGNWTDADKVTVAVLKLTGAAALFLNSNEETKSETITFSRLREIFIDRFRIKHLDQFYYTALQNATQHKYETPEQFADRCRRLCAQTVRHVTDPAQQRIINEEAERRMLAAYTNGLYGSVGRQIRYRMPSTLTEAIQIATTVQEVELMETRRNQSRNNNYPPSNGNQKIFLICFKCNKAGHLAKDCRTSKRINQTKQRSGQNSNNNSNNYQNRSMNSNGNNKMRIQCYACQKYGHYANECRDNKSNPKGQGSTWNSANLPSQKQ